MVYLFAMVAIQSIHLITSLVNCLSDISFTDTWKQMPEPNVTGMYLEAGRQQDITIAYCFVFE